MTATAKKGRIIKIAVILLTVLVTHLAMRYIYRKMDAVKASVVCRRRKARCVARLESPFVHACVLLTWRFVPPRPVMASRPGLNVVIAPALPAPSHRRPT